MKNNRLFIVLIILVFIAGIYFFSNTKGSLSIRNSSFAIKSPDDIAKIQISTSKEKIVLEKDHKHWNVNSKYRATDKYVENLILALNRIVVLSPVSKVEKDQVASLLKKDGILVEIFSKRWAIKKYYVSKPAMNKAKTYMMMLRSSEPFIVEVPAFEGLLSKLFVTDENYWRDKTIFDYEPQNIKNICVEYPQETSKSFKVINYNNGTFAIQNINTNSFIKKFDVNKVARYFTYYQRIVFENVIENLNQTQIDSVLQSTPFSIITVEDIYGGTNKIKIYRKPSEKKFDEFGHKIKFDYDRAYATFNDNKELIEIQYYIFDPLFKEIDYFR